MTTQIINDIPLFQPPRPNSFVDLPLEIRLEIYRFIFPIYHIPLHVSLAAWKAHYHPGRQGWPHQTGVLRLSKQISEEALDVLYGENRFSVILSKWNHDVWDGVTPRNRQRIRHVFLIGALGRGPLSGEALMPSASWTAIIANLTNLKVVLPGTPRIIRLKPVWTEGIRCLLECINKNGRDSLLVELDHDGKEDLTGLFQACLTRVRWRRVITRDGDGYFGRRGPHTSL